MIVLDTNVVSEVMRPSPSREVMTWLAAQVLEGLAITSVTLAEIHYGLQRLPIGRRRAELEQKFQVFLIRGFMGRILPFDEGAAEAYAEIVNAREKNGRPIEAFDAMIAAIAQRQKATVATRDLDGFADCGIRLIDPWK